MKVGSRRCKPWNHSPLRHRSFDSRLLALLLLLYVAPAGSREISPDSMVKRFDQFWRKTEETAGLSQASVAKLIADNYDAVFPPELRRNTLQGIDAADLKLLFRAAQAAAFYAVSVKYVRDMQSVLDELERRGLAPENYYADLYRALVAVRETDEARNLAAKMPALGLEALPAFRAAAGLRSDEPTEWVVDARKYEVWRRSAHLAGCKSSWCPIRCVISLGMRPRRSPWTLDSAPCFAPTRSGWCRRPTNWRSRRCSSGTPSTQRPS